MGIQYFQANNIATTLNGAINNSVTSITVTSSTGFPSTPFVAIIDTELVLVTNVSGTTWTVTRGSESTTAAAHSNLAEVRQITTAAAWNALVQLQTGTLTSQTGSIQLTSGRVSIDSSGTGTAGVAINSTDGQAISATVSGSAGAIFVSATSGRGIDLTSTGNDGIVSSTNAGGHYALEGINASSSDGAGAAGKLDGGTHTNGLQVVNNHATKETVNATNSGAGSAGIFANSGAGATLTATNNSTGNAGVFANTGSGTTVTATNSGAGDGLLGTTANNAQFGVKGTNTASTDGAGAGGKFDGGTHTVGAIITTNHATKEALTLTNAGGGPGLVTPNTKVNGLLYTVDTYANRPGSPATGDIHYATDRHIEYFWDSVSSNWLSTTLYSFSLGIVAGATLTYSTTNSVSNQGDRPFNYDMYIVDFMARFKVDTTFDATNNWSIQLQRTNSSNANTTVSTISTWVTARSAGTFYFDVNGTINTVVTIANGWRFIVNLVKNSAPGAITMNSPAFTYRIVG